jgi:hypothetical protein
MVQIQLGLLPVVIPGITTNRTTNRGIDKEFSNEGGDARSLALREPQYTDSMVETMTFPRLESERRVCEDFNEYGR